MKQNLSKIPNSIEELEQWTTRSRVPGRQQKLLRFKTLLELLNISIPSSQVVKIAGTNGKGSVAAMLEAIFLADAQKVVLFTSPHLSRVTERIRVDGAEISPDVLDDAVRRLALKLVRIVNEQGNHLLPSFFEILTLIALEHFRFCGADIIILEAGIGGYNDVIHLLPGKVSLITSVGLDHTQQLGATLSEIATDKAGIASPDSTLVLGPDIPESALKAILEDAQRRSIEIVSARSEIFQVQSLGVQGHQVTLSSEMGNKTFILPLAGSFQLENLATAKAALDVLISKQIIHNQQSFFGVSQVRWFGRMELIPGNPAWLLDGAHNAHAIAKITADIVQLAQEKEVAILLGLSDHNDDLVDLEPYLKKLAEAIPGAIYLTSGFYRALEPLDYLSIFQDESLKVINLGDYQSAIDKLINIYQSKENSFIVVTGSLFLIGAAREYIISTYIFFHSQ